MADKENKRKCFRCGCSPAVDNVKLFRFPKPAVKNLVRCQLWAEYIFPERECSSVDLQNKLHSEHRMLCQKHFKDSDFTDGTKQWLQRTAVPCDLSITVQDRICRPCLQRADRFVATQIRAQELLLVSQDNTGSAWRSTTEPCASSSQDPEEPQMSSDDEDAAQIIVVEEDVLKEETPELEDRQCHLCLSVDRELKELAGYAPLYMKLLSDNCQNSKVPNFMYQMLACWECRAELRRIQKFQDKVRRANAAFMTSQNLSCGNLSTLSAVLIRTDPCQNEMTECGQKTQEEEVEALEMEVEEMDKPDPLELTVDIEAGHGYAQMRRTEIAPTLGGEEGVRTYQPREKRAGDNQPLRVDKRPKLPLIIRKKSRIASNVAQDAYGSSLTSQNQADAATDCNATFTIVRMDFEELQRILAEKKSKPSFKNMKHKCDPCVLGFTAQCHLHDHFMSCHDESVGAFECDICYRRFESVGALSTHRDRHLLKFVCKLCRFECLTTRGRAAHCKRHRALNSVLRSNVHARAATDASDS